MNPIQMHQMTEWNRMLTEMRQAKAQAGGPAGAPVLAADPPVAAVTFGGILSDALHQVNGQLAGAEQLAVAFEKGQADVDLPDVMIAMQKAHVGLQATVQVRNKCIEAYKEIMNMPV